MKRAKVKAKKAAAKAPQQAQAPLTWEEKVQLPIGLFHTLVGPIIGLVGSSVTIMGIPFVRVYAPAKLNHVLPANVVFLPISFVEDFMDLAVMTTVGVSQAPAVVVTGYRGFVEQFRAGSYRMQPVVMNAKVDAPEGEHSIVDDGACNLSPATPISMEPDTQQNTQQTNP